MALPELSHGYCPAVSSSASEPSPRDASRRDSVRAGARSVAPMLIGIIPFGLVAGAAPVSEGLGGGVAAGLSLIVFAGASQLAAVEMLADGSSTIAVALVIWTINLRMLLYSASLAPVFSRLSLPSRLGAAYYLTDQSYAVTITKFPKPTENRRELSYYLGAAVLLWAAWQISTWVGVAVGAALPDSVPLTFAVPLVFLVLLVPVVRDRPSIAAAVFGGVGAVVAVQLGAENVSVMIGGAVGIIAGVLVDFIWGRSEPSEDDAPGAVT
jgi:predicted branched-subunit amino acid permease